MRSLVRSFVIASCLSFATAEIDAQTPRPQATRGQTPASKTTPTAAATQPVGPQFRPAVLRSGADSLVNRIDVKALLEKGQKDGAVQFAVAVSPDGNAIETWTYRPMPECDALEQEVMKRLEDAKFTPPIYNYQPAAALLYGTVIFAPGASPRLRVLLNQDPEEIKATSDFIAPQPVIGGPSRFVGLHPPELSIPVEGVVDVELDVDVKGNLQDIKLVTEDPPLVGFREAVARDLSGAKFIPAFRDGDATKSAATMSVCYKAAEFDTQPYLEAPGLELESSPSESIAPSPSPE